MLKKYYRVIVFAAVFLIIATIVISFDNFSTEKEAGIKREYYASFVSSVQTLERTIAQTNGTEFNDVTLHMFDVYTSIIFVNDRLTLLKENTKSFSEMDELINDLLIFRIRYASLVRQQINHDHVNPEVLAKVIDQIQLFESELPQAFEDSNDFSNQLNAADQHIKPLLDITI